MPGMLSIEEVKKIAKLCKLTLTEDDYVKFQSLLSEALDYVKVLDEIDTSTVIPTSQVTGIVNSFQEDKKRECLNPDEAIYNAPRKKESFVVTEAVLHKTTFKL